MVSDGAAIAFAKWLDAYKLYVQAQRQLDAAERMSRQFGGQPPQYLVDQVRFMKQESDRLLEIALVEAGRK